MVEHQQLLNSNSLQLPNTRKFIAPDHEQTSQIIQLQFFKRAIPGVVSDTYHLGFFEDNTLHNMEPVIHTQYEALVDALRIFLLVLTVYVLLTALLFGIREYSFAMKNRKKQMMSDIQWCADQTVEIPLNSVLGSNLISPVGECDLDGQKHVNRAYPDIKKKNPSEPNSCLSNFSKVSGEQNGRYNTKSTSDATPFEPFAPIEVVKISSEFTSGSIDEFGLITLSSASMMRGKKKKNTRSRTIYSIKEIMALKPVEYEGIPLVRSETPGGYDNDLTVNCVRQLTRLSFPLRNRDFEGPRVAENEISDVCLNMTNEIPTKGPVLKFSKKLATFKFIAIGVNSTTLQNPNVFLQSFSNTMDGLIDSGTLFDILDDVNAYNARLLVDVIIQYCYSHWFYDSFSEASRSLLFVQFMRWPMKHGPIVQQRDVILRYLVNMSLGMHTVSNLDEDTMKLAKNKIQMMMVHCIENTNCYDHIGITPLLSQGIGFSENNESRILFYRSLYCLIKKHAHCCMDRDFFTGRGLLKRLVQSGLYYLNPHPIRRYASDILSILVDMDFEFQSWSNEVKGGKMSLPTKPRLSRESEYRGLSNSPQPQEYGNKVSEAPTPITDTKTSMTRASLEQQGSNSITINPNHVAPKATPGYFFRKP